MIPHALFIFIIHDLTTFLLTHSAIAFRIKEQKAKYSLPHFLGTGIASLMDWTVIETRANWQLAEG